MKAPAWIAELRRAMMSNLYDKNIRDADPVDVAKLFGGRRGIPYQFLGERHPIRDLAESRRRGWAACGDAAAAVGAAVIADRGRGSLCIEAPRNLLTYTHVRIIYEVEPRPIALDPYAPERADVAASCEWVIDLADMVSGSLRMVPAVAA
jgi:hypothetical protein